MQIENKLISDLIPYANNAREHSEEQVLQIASSIKEFGFNNPVLIDKDNGIIAGHGRLEAAKKLGMTEVPTIRLEHLTDTQKKAFILADNRIAINSTWDTDLLSLELTDIKDDFDLNMLGFNDDEINVLTNPIEELDYEEEEIPEPPVEPKTKLGDIYQLGNHKLMCGDSTSIDDVDKLMPETAAMLFTDPPYLMAFEGNVHADGSKSFNAKHGAIKNDKMSEQEGDDFLDSVNGIIQAKVDGAFYITFYRLGIDKYYNSLNRTGLQVRSLIIWDKGNHTLSNSDYMSMYEPMFYGWVNNHKFYGGNNGVDIWNIKRTAKNDLHPTMKPVELVEKAIKDGSKQNDIVLDLFGGSGTTLIACESTGRQARLMELDPKYCDVIVERWENITGKKAELLT